MNNSFTYIILLFGIILLNESTRVAGSQVLRLRGVPIINRSLYPSDKDFECFDGSLLIPFHYVNDDYCDCADGTDEPGTAACGRGMFYCENVGHKSYYVPSSRVNDGICDCCDGSDEYASKKTCINNCHDLGKEARLEAQKAAELLREGNKIRLEMMTRGKQMKSEYQIRLTKVRMDHNEAELLKKEKEVLKKQAEERETLALEKYKPVEELDKEKVPVDEDKKLLEAEDYFKLLDSDSSGTITINELQTRTTFDKDRDGIVSNEEAMFFLNNQNEVTLQEFIDYTWPNIKSLVILEQGMFQPGHKEGVKTEDNHENVKESFAEEQEIDHSEEEGEEEHTEANEQETEQETEQEVEQETEPETPQVQYDEETQLLIDEATNAREQFQEAEKAVNDLSNEIRTLEEKLNRDYGPDEEFASTDGECYEYSDLEYIYSLCMFGKTSQRSKSGGADISLGYWHEWIGPENNKYSKMKFDKGLTCWNGPARSTIVNLSCGKENKLLSVTEPNRCEYSMGFSTPALCIPSVGTSIPHDEL